MTIKFSQVAFKWRQRIIRKYQPEDRVILESEDPVVITWQGFEYSWEGFLREFARFCEPYDEVPF